MTPPPAARSGTGPSAPRRLLASLGIVLVALLPTVAAPGGLDAPVISDTGAVLGRVHAHGAPGAIGDWTGPQYGMRIVRFWRPMVTGSVALQEAWTGIDPAPLRLANAACHALAALLVAGLALRLGAGGAGAFAAGLVAAAYPEHGGAVTWVVGRVDTLCAPFFLGAGWLALAARPADGARSTAAALAAAAAAFLACATKEIAFVLPAWVGLLALGRGDRPREALRVVAPVLAACAVAFLWRRLALGAWIGGYPQPGEGPSAVSVARAVRAATSALLGAYGVCLAFVLVLFVLPVVRVRAFVACVGAAAVCVVPLYGLLLDGTLEPQNARTLYLADLTLALGLGVVPAAVRGPRLALAVGLLVLLAGVRLQAAAADAREWAAAGEAAGEVVQELRAEAGALPPSDLPVLAYGIPRNHRGAYCLAFGVADRFRAPFPASARPVWPMRPLFDAPPEVGVRREPVVPPRRKLVDPFADARRSVPLLPVTVGGERAFEPLVLDETIGVEPDASPVLEVWEGAELPPDARFELVVYTEAGYGAGFWIDAGRGAVEPVPGALPGGDAARVRRASLRRLLFAPTPTGFQLYWNLLQAADLGARTALLEVRAVGADGALLAASRPLAIAWPDDLIDRLSAP